MIRRWRTKHGVRKVNSLLTVKNNTSIGKENKYIGVENKAKNCKGGQQYIDNGSN